VSGSAPCGCWRLPSTAIYGPLRISCSELSPPSSRDAPSSAAPRLLLGLCGEGSILPAGPPSARLLLLLYPSRLKRWEHCTLGSKKIKTKTIGRTDTTDRTRFGLPSLRGFDKNNTSAARRSQLPCAPHTQSTPPPRQRELHVLALCPPSF